MNGNTAVAANSNLTFKTVAAAGSEFGQPGVFPPANLTQCYLHNTTSGASFTLGTQLPGDTALVCIHEVTVTPQDILIGYLPAFNVIACLDTACTGSTKVAEGSVAKVGLYSKPKLLASTTWVSTPLQKETGECVSCCRIHLPIWHPGGVSTQWADVVQTYLTFYCEQNSVQLQTTYNADMATCTTSMKGCHLSMLSSFFHSPPGEHTLCACS